ncbi:MAG: aldo/keto reductase [bacterium]
MNTLQSAREDETPIVRLVLGTAQLGFPYGVANQKGQPSTEDACGIIQAAFGAGIRIFDTAQAYGESEAVLGRCFRSLGIESQVKVISKLHPDLNCHDPSCLFKSVLASISRLGVDSLYGLMLHRASLLSEWNKGLGQGLAELKKRHLLTFLGVSVYTPKEALDALAINEIDLIQAPFNIFDRRLIFAGVLDLAHQLRKQVFLRSIFLQGLILLPFEKLPKHLSFAREPLARLDAFCREHGLDRKEFAFDYAWQRTKDAPLVMGVESKEQIMENIHLAEVAAQNRLARNAPEGNRNCLEGAIIDAWDSLELAISQKLINPSLWSQ